MTIDRELPINFIYEKGEIREGKDFDARILTDGNPIVELKIQSKITFERRDEAAGKLFLYVNSKYGKTYRSFLCMPEIHLENGFITIMAVQLQN